MEYRSTGEVIRDLCYQAQDIGIRVVRIHHLLEAGKVSEAKRKLQLLAVELGFVVLVCDPPTRHHAERDSNAD